MQRIREVTYAAGAYDETLPLSAKMRGGGSSRHVHWVRARLGLAEMRTCRERLANAGYKGTFPADIYNAARILCPLLGLLAGASIPYEPRCSG